MELSGSRLLPHCCGGKSVGVCSSLCKMCIELPLVVVLVLKKPQWPLVLNLKKPWWAKCCLVKKE